jgi:biopolymer transport protein ExbB/TolQ
MDSMRKSITAYTVSLAAAIGIILLLQATLSPMWVRFFLDYGENTIFPYPYTIQNFMYCVMAVALAQLWLRWRAAEHEHRLNLSHLLPEDSQSMLEFSDPKLGAIRRNAAQLLVGQGGYLPYLIEVSVSQFLSSKSVDQVIAVFNSSIDILSHRVDLHYQMLRYLVWLIPTIGFIGTVVGIAVALEGIDAINPDLKMVTERLGIAFYTTIVALIQSMIIFFLQSLVQKREEEALNGAASACLKNLINRMFVNPSAEEQR